MKQKNKKLKILLTIIICCFSLLITCIDSNAETNSVKNSCSPQSADNKYQPEMTDDENGTITVSVATGTFKVVVFRSETPLNGDTTTSIDTPLDLTPNNKSVSIRYSTTVDTDLEIVLVLSASDDLCLTAPVTAADGSTTQNNIEVKNNPLLQKLASAGISATNSTYIHYETFSISGDYSNVPVSNESYDTVCKAFREGTNWETYFKGTGLTKAQFEKYSGAAIGEQTYRNYGFDYCYNQQVSASYSEKDIIQMIVNTIESYSLDIIGTGSGSVSLTPPADAITVTDTDLSGQPLVCDPFTDSTDTDYYANKKKYYTKSTDTVKTKKLKNSGKTLKCETACEETITVEYGPPQATKGGLCFEYKVKVVSKVNCQSKVTGASRPKLSDSDYNYCIPKPNCNNSGELYETQGGPNDDFDQCVQECDGGEYSQSCINQCYNEVYGSDSSSMNALALNYGDITPLQIAKTYNILNDTTTTDYNALRKAVVNEGEGYYYRRKDGRIDWCPVAADEDGNCPKEKSKNYWENCGTWYFVYQAARTVRETGPGKAYTCSEAPSGYHGFKRRTSCLESCRWQGCRAKYINKSDAIEAYNEDLETYNDFVRQCKAQASCTTKEAEFTISVNNKTNSEPNKDNWIDYDKAVISGTNIKSDSDNIILDRGGCYGEANTEYDYMTEWSFPGTWKNLKTGEISYEPVTGTAWKKRDKKFCTLLDSKDVNEEWWTWYVTRNADPDITESEKNNITNNLEYNIKATVRDFGHFSWDFDINCFYGLYDNAPDTTCTPGDPNCQEPTPTSTSTSTPNTTNQTGLSYRIRSVDNTNLFPSTTGESSLPGETGRTPGFNWTSAATNLNNPDYEITPGALLTTIQRRGNTIYDADSQSDYLDYEFILDKEAIQKIRNYSKENQNNYTNFGGTLTLQNGVLVYKSDLFRGSGSSISANKLGTIGCNNERDGVCETFTDDYVETVR